MRPRVPTLSATTILVLSSLCRSATMTASAASAPTCFARAPPPSSSSRPHSSSSSVSRLSSAATSATTSSTATTSSSSSSAAAAPPAAAADPTPKSRAAEQAAGTLIVGGGLAGLATAAALRTVAGVRNVRVLESCTQAQFVDANAGAAAQLGPNGLRALRLIAGGDGDGDEVVDKVRGCGTELEGNGIILPGPPGVMFVSDAAKDDTGLPQVLVRWGLLRSTLSDLLPEGTVTTDAGREIAGYRQVEDSGGLEAIDGSGNSLDLPSSPTLLVGADGIRSTFRALVRSSATALSSSEIEAARGADIKYGGRINVKAVVDRPLGDDYKPGHTYAYFTPGGGVACFAGPAGKGSTYWAISLADDADEETGCPTTFLDDVDNNGGGNLEEKTKTKLLARLEGLDSSSEVQFVIDHIRETDPSTILIQRSEEAMDLGPSLHSSDGNVVLVGDAAHAMSASYGQAANFALEDAATLAACVRDSDDLRVALERYSEGRLERCREMQRRSAERAARAMRGEQAEDVSKWIFEWDIQ